LEARSKFTVMATRTAIIRTFRDEQPQALYTATPLRVYVSAQWSVDAPARTCIVVYTLRHGGASASILAGKATYWRVSTYTQFCVYTTTPCNSSRLGGKPEC